MKLSIKSFKVPELFIDIPETATIGSLKVCDSTSSERYNEDMIHTQLLCAEISNGGCDNYTWR